MSESQKRKTVRSPSREDARLTTVSIADGALGGSVHLKLESKRTVLVGRNGAGKSLFLESLNDAANLAVRRAFVGTWASRHSVVKFSAAPSTSTTRSSAPLATPRSKRILAARAGSFGIGPKGAPICRRHRMCCGEWIMVSLRLADRRSS